MPLTSDPLAALIAPHIVPHAQQMNMPYLGYHLLRETITQKLLGNSEEAILYWMGKDMGTQIELFTPDELEMIFVRLGLGKLELIDEKPHYYHYSLSHYIFEFLSLERLKRTLSLETGLIAGCLQQLRQAPVHAELEVTKEPASKATNVHIYAYVDQDQE